MEKGKRKESDRGWEKEREGDSRDWMIGFQLCSAAVEGLWWPIGVPYSKCNPSQTQYLSTPSRDHQVITHPDPR